MKLPTHIVATLAAIVIHLATVHCLTVKCNATKEIIRFTVNDAVQVIEKMVFLHKTLLDPWTNRSNCSTVSETVLECPSSRESRPQNFRIDVTFADGTNTSKELWFYECYENHGVRDIAKASVDWNSFVVTWSHYDMDENFVKEDEITVIDADNKVLHQTVNGQNKEQSYRFTKASPLTNYTVCVKTTFFKFATDTSATRDQETEHRCVHLRTAAQPKEKGTNLKTTLLAVGIGILCLVLLCMIFVVYNKRCKQGGDHDYDMNKETSLMAGEGGNDGEELQVYNNDEDDKKEKNSSDSVEIV